MILVYCPDERRLDQLVAAIPPEYDTVAVSGPAECFGGIASATCLVIGLSDAADARASVWLRKRPARGLVPLVLVVPEEPETARRVATAAPAAVAWWHGVHRELGPAIERAIGSTLFGRVASTIEASRDLPVALRSGLAAACRTVPPIVSVSKLSKEAGRSDRWLERCWRDVVPNSDYRLEDFLASLLLVRARLIAADGASRKQVAEAVGRSVPTLDRHARRLMRTTFHGLRSTPAQQITDAFRELALAPIADGTILRKLTR